MAPKKKGNKRQEEDWEADLGESAPTTASPPAEDAAAAPADEDNGMGGGLLAALRKNKAKKGKKGKPVNDFVEGEDAAQDTNDAATDFASKQPEEGGFDDEDDVFSGKAKPNKKAAAAAAPAPKDAGDDGEIRVKSKKEKEREKKEREKQRKKEQVCLFGLLLRRRESCSRALCFCDAHETDTF